MILNAFACQPASIKTKQATDNLTQVG